VRDELLGSSFHRGHDDGLGSLAPARSLIFPIRPHRGVIMPVVLYIVAALPCGSGAALPIPGVAPIATTQTASTVSPHPQLRGPGSCEALSQGVSRHERP
jgi:hypothetical protein